MNGLNGLNNCTTDTSAGTPWPVLSSGIRELTAEELGMASGGLPFLIPPIVASGVKWGGAIFVGTIISKAANDFYNEFMNPTPSCQM